MLKERGSDVLLSPMLHAQASQLPRMGHACYRAAKFGVEYREPEKRRDLRHVARKEKALERVAARPVGFTPGMDLYSQVSG